MRLFKRNAAQDDALGEFVVEPLRETIGLYRGWPRPKLSTLPLGQALTGRSDEELRASAFILLRTFAGGGNHIKLELLSLALSTMGRRKLAWTPEEASRVVAEATAAGGVDYQTSVGGFVAAVLEQAGGATDPAAVARYSQLLGSTLSPSDAARLLNRLRPFTPELRGPVDLRVVSDGDGWGRSVRALLKQISDPTGVDDLLHHLGSSATRPSKKWLARTRDLVTAAPAGPELVRSMLQDVLAFDLQPGRDQWSGPVLFTGANAEVARGAAFAVALSDQPDASLLGDVAAYSGTTSGGSGVARDEKVANGCVAALGLIGTDDAVAALTRVQQKVKNRNVRKQVDRSLVEAANAAGTSVDELIERSVPTHRLGLGGFSESRLADREVRVAVDGDKVRVLVAKPGGGWTSTVPARIRDDHPSELAALRAVAKEATKTLVAERTRLESLLASDRSWPLAEWIRLYRDHPLTGAWAARLLWQVEDATGSKSVRVDGANLVAVDSTQVTAAIDAVIRLWHPMAAPADEVQQWRDELERLGLRQPFKQAWREVYLLTEAEERTETYSNRFAAHILRYPQAFALMKGRDWATAALGYWDGGYDGNATKVFPGGRWRAAFFYDLVEDAGDNYGTPSLCSTDQVRFQELVGIAWETMPLTAVPPLVFSEAMRDVDLFVGVASIAADPEWADRGEERHLDYWHQASFGDLSESAATRRMALERLLPRMKIADRVSLDGRFLRVRGTHRTYKIHIGSGNILMEPNDQYLCIVPSRDKSLDRIFLPFEEDGGRLSVIVSKALLLAEDDKITDRSILSQISRR